MSFEACEISVSIKDSTVNDLIVANKNIRKLKSEKGVLQYPNLGNIEHCSIICFSDAAFANLTNAHKKDLSYFCIKVIKIMHMRDVKSGLFPIHCYTDSKSLLESVYSTKTLAEKWLKVDVCVIREILEKKEIRSINSCPSNRHLADC